MTIIPILQMGKLRHEVIKKLARVKQMWVLDPNSLVLKSGLLIMANKDGKDIFGQGKACAKTQGPGTNSEKFNVAGAQ